MLHNEHFAAWTESCRYRVPVNDVRTVHDVCAAALVSPPAAAHRERRYLENDARPSCLEYDQGNFAFLPGTSATIRTALLCRSFFFLL